MKKIILLLTTTLLIVSCNYTNTEIIRDAKIIDKERVVKNSGESIDSFYLIYTDKGEFTIKDELFRGNFKSSNWYGYIEKGKCYNFAVGGYRIGVLSSYQNIHQKPILVNCK